MPQASDVSDDRPRPSRVILLSLAAVILGACASSPTAPNFTYQPAPSTSAGAPPSALPSTEPSVEPTSGPSAAPSAEPTAGSTSGPSAEPSAGSTSGPSAAPIGVPPSGTAIYLSEWSVGLPTSMLAGQNNFAITNIGTIQHELLVFKSDLPPSAYPLDKNGDIVEDGPGINLISDGDNIDPGKTQTRTVDLSQAGSYLFVCNIPGHFKAGMFSELTVAP
jgi:hypothetical protein